MSTLDNLPQSEPAQPRDATVFGLFAVGIGVLASLLWVAFLGWGLGWVVAQLINWLS